MAQAKKEAHLKRGGAEMKKIFNIEPRIPSIKRPHTVDTSSTTFYRYGHSHTLNGHDHGTCDKHGPRHKHMLRQRYVGYPVSVPDVSKGSVDEVQFRRTAHKAFLEEDSRIFRKSFAPECTSDYFNQKHLIRNYLNTMHPYSDPEDRGRTYNMSRLKTQERDLDPMPQGDFLKPEDPVRPRSTGYSAGHTRTILGLDSFGPGHSERLRLARLVGELPASPNVDREAAIGKAAEAGRSESPLTARSNSTVSTAPGSADSRGRGNGRRRPKTIGSLDAPGMYLPPHMHRIDDDMNTSSDRRPHNYGPGTSSLEAPGPDYDRPLGADDAATDAQRLGFDPMPGMSPSERLHSHEGNRHRSNSSSNNNGNNRAQTTGGDGSRKGVHMAMDTFDPANDDGQHTARSNRSHTSRGGHKPPGVPRSPNPNTQTGTLGYHGQAITKDELIMKDPIGRGIEWFHRTEERRKDALKKKEEQAAHRSKRAAIQEDVDSAVVDLAAFEVALEFRRTAKPADLPENNTRRSKLKASQKSVD